MRSIFILPLAIIISCCTTQLITAGSKKNAVKKEAKQEKKEMKRWISFGTSARLNEIAESTKSIHDSTKALHNLIVEHLTVNEQINNNNNHELHKELKRIIELVIHNTDLLNEILAALLSINCQSDIVLGALDQVSADPNTLVSPADIDEETLTVIQWLKTIYRKMIECEIS